MKFRLRTLLTQFSLRDLFWLLLLAAVVSYAYRDRRAMQLDRRSMQLQFAEMKSQTQAEAAKLAKATAARDDERRRYWKLAEANLKAILDRPIESQPIETKLDLSYPIYYP